MVQGRGDGITVERRPARVEDQRQPVERRWLHGSEAKKVQLRSAADPMMIDQFSRVERRYEYDVMRPAKLRSVADPVRIDQFSKGERRYESNEMRPAKVEVMPIQFGLIKLSMGERMHKYDVMRPANMEALLILSQD